MPFTIILLFPFIYVPFIINMFFYDLYNFTLYLFYTLLNIHWQHVTFNAPTNFKKIEHVGNDTILSTLLFDCQL